MRNKRTRTSAGSVLLHAIRNLALAGMLVWEIAPTLAASTDNGNHHFADSGDYVHIVGLIRVTGEDKVVVTLRVDRGFHINANPASQPYLIPTTLSFIDAAPFKIIYPLSTRFKPAFSDEPLDVYEGTVTITAFFHSGALEEASPLHATVTVQACTDRICLPPADLSVSG